MPKKKKPTFRSKAKQAGKVLLQKYQARQAYLKSPEYKAKVNAMKQQQLRDLDYQIALEKRKRALAKARGQVQTRTARQVQRPLGLDLGAELGLS